MSVATEDDLYDLDESFTEGASGVPHKPGKYRAIITSVADGGYSTYTKPGEKAKKRLKFIFEVDGVGEIFYWTSRSFGYTKVYGWSALVRLIAAVTGKKPGEQEDVKLGDVVGIECYVVTELSDKGFPRIKEVLPFNG